MLLTKKDWVNGCVFFLWVCSCLPQICPPLLSLSFTPSSPPSFLSFLKKLGRNVLIERWPKSFFNFLWKLLLCFHFSQLFFESSTTTPKFLVTRANREPVKYYLLGIVPKFELFSMLVISPVFSYCRGSSSMWIGLGDGAGSLKVSRRLLNVCIFLSEVPHRCYEYKILKGVCDP